MQNTTKEQCLVVPNDFTVAINKSLFVASIIEKQQRKEERKRNEMQRSSSAGSDSEPEDDDDEDNIAWAAD